MCNKLIITPTFILEGGGYNNEKKEDISAKILEELECKPIICKFCDKILCATCSNIYTEYETYDTGKEIMKVPKSISYCSDCEDHITIIKKKKKGRF